MSPRRKCGSRRLTSAMEPKWSVPPAFGAGVEPAAAAAAGADVGPDTETVGDADGAAGAQAAATIVPTPDAIRPRAVRRLSEVDSTDVNSKLPMCAGGQQRCVAGDPS